VSYDAIVPAGGAAVRLGGIDKAMVPVAGRTLIERAIDAVAGAGRVVVVGPPRDIDREIVWTREEPPGGGPVAAVGAGLDEVTADVVIVLASDLPFIDAEVIGRLVDAIGARDGAIAVDRGGRDQMLVGAYRTDALRRAVERLPEVAGASMRTLISALDVARVTDDDAAIDCDTWADVERASARGGN
jgi:molybdopterin-guanine dinucleotide biosynthesis protein A